MRIIIFLCLISLGLAEPPIRDSYLDAAESLQDHGPHQQYIPDLTVPAARHQTNPRHVPTSRISQHDGTHFRNSVSQVYGAPKNSRLSQEYGTPESRDSLSQVYGAPKNSRLSQEYGAPEFRDSLSPVYGVPQNSRISQEYGAPEFRDLPQEYGLPKQESFRSLSQEYRVPASQYDTRKGQRFSSGPKSSVTHYGSPTSRNLPSSSYLPSQRSTQYGEPNTEDLSHSFTRSSSPVQKYGVPKFQSRDSQSDGYDSLNPSLAVRNHQSKLSSQFGARSLSTQYGAPEARNVYSEPLENYGVPNARIGSQDYGQAAGRSIGRKTNAFAASFSVKSPSQQYSVPQSRQVESMPSNQYGVPSEVDSDQGYQYARNALDLLNQEPANYEFGYKVDDYESGSDFGHVESRQDHRAEGSYFVVLPDGTKQVVEYEADEEGFKPRISVEPAADTDNAGPY